MNGLFRKALALIGQIDDPDAQKRLFDRFGGGAPLMDLYRRMERVMENTRVEAPDIFAEDFPDPNMVASYLDHPSEESRYQRLYEDACLDSDILLAEVACASVILNHYHELATRAPKSCRKRAYAVMTASGGDISSKDRKGSKSAYNANSGGLGGHYGWDGTKGDYSDPISGENPFRRREETVSESTENPFRRSSRTSSERFHDPDLYPESSAERFTDPSRPSSKPSDRYREEPARNAFRRSRGLGRRVLLLLVALGALYFFGPRLYRQYQNSISSKTTVSQMNQGEPSPQEPVGSSQTNPISDHSLPSFGQDEEFSPFPFSNEDLTSGSASSRPSSDTSTSSTPVVSKGSSSNGRSLALDPSTGSPSERTQSIKLAIPTLPTQNNDIFRQ